MTRSVAPVGQLRPMRKVTAARQARGIAAEFDVDKSGYLDRAELTEALKSLGLDTDRQELNAVIQHLDLKAIGSHLRADLDAAGSGHGRDTVEGGILHERLQDQIGDDRVHGFGTHL